MSSSPSCAHRHDESEAAANADRLSSATASAPAAIAPPPVSLTNVWWQYKSGHWETYDEVTNAKIEAAFQTAFRRDTLFGEVEINNGSNAVIFDTWEQRHNDTGVRLEVRRFNTQNGEIRPRLCSKLMCYNRVVNQRTDDFCKAHISRDPKLCVGRPNAKPWKEDELKPRMDMYKGCGNIGCARPCWRQDIFCERANCKPGGAFHLGIRPENSAVKCKARGCYRFGEKKKDGYCGEGCLKKSRDEDNIEILLSPELILHPIRSSVFISGKNSLVAWTGFENITLVNIQLFRLPDGGVATVLQDVGCNVPNEPNVRNSFQWTLPVNLALHDDYQIKISGKSESQIFAVWSSTFSVVNPYFEKITDASRHPFTQIQGGIAEIEEVESDAFSTTWSGKFDGKVVILRGYSIAEETKRGPKMEKLRAIRAEISCMNVLQHPNIAQFFGIILQDLQFKEVTLVMEDAEHGSLFDFLHKAQERHPLEYDPISWAIDIVEGMNALQQFDIVHCDLQSANVLLSGQPARCKLSGFARAFVPGTNPKPVHLQSVKYMAPELIRAPELNSFSSSVFSFGMILSELFGAGIPYGDLGADAHDLQIIFALSNMKYKDRLRFISSKFDVSELILRCWNLDYNDRPSFAVLLDLLKTYQEDKGTFSLNASAQAVQFVDDGVAQTPMLPRPPAETAVFDVSVFDDAVIRRGKFIANGAYGDVFASVLNHPPKFQNCPVALKIVAPTNYKMRQIAIEANNKEIELLRRCTHPNVVELFGRYQTPDHVGYVCELASGNLGKRLDELSAALPDAYVLSFATDIAKGVNYLHKIQRIEHRDLKPENVLLFDNLPSEYGAPTTCKLCDFGLSNRAVRVINHGVKGGTPKFDAPEVMAENIFTFQSDVYSYSILLYCILTKNSHPLPARQDWSVMIDVAYKNLRPNLDVLPAGIIINSSWRTLLTNTWARKPDNRYTFDRILEYLERYSKDGSARRSTATPLSVSSPGSRVDASASPSVSHASSTTDVFSPSKNEDQGPIAFRPRPEEEAEGPTDANYNAGAAGIVGAETTDQTTDGDEASKHVE